MSLSTIHLYFRAVFPTVPMWHVIVIGVLSLVLTAGLKRCKRLTKYGALFLGLSVMLGLYLLDALALTRIGRQWVEHPGIDLEAEVRRIVSGNKENRILMQFNVAAFVPFGFFLAEFLALTKRFRSGRRIWLVVLAGFGLSLFIECIQLVFRVGLFELTDLVLNTAGAVIGAGLSLVIHCIIHLSAKTKAYG